ncbi:hypothetical protein DYD21_09595 [Rhodohalobacter sp. SW132]|uniref:hypothetical protein n=1 Tax=Rhodohalobacter sp. SW132 TaxID=2293433 RepID=UPI000E21FAD1|nr:hypothetical protein [Rhodohalobacter sp. SW132]REL33652.1 hypothetical protein DYD21_09595 [Rhodohalobacter sp. SW132]
MGLKRSLGFSPIDSLGDEKSEFSYVGDNRPRSGRSDSIFSDYQNDSSMSLANSFTEKMKAQKAQQENLEEQDRPEKKVASYYLEVETLNKLKEWADSAKASYSSVVEAAIQAHLGRVTG